MKKHYVLLIVILVVAFIVRLYRIDAPLADWHSWRQVDTAGVTREFLKNGIDLLHPRYMDISSIPSGQFNPRGWRMVEFPIVNGLVALVVKTANQFGVFGDLVVFERLMSIVFSLGSTVFLYAIVRMFLPETTALLSAAVFALLPFNIYFSRAVLPEPKLVFFSLMSSFCFVRFLIKGTDLQRSNLTRSDLFLLVLGTVGAALATLLKPFWLIVFGPALLWIFLVKERQNLFRLRPMLPFLFSVLLALAPFLLWRLWIQQFPSGIPASDWLFNAGGIRFRPAWFRWLFADRLGRLILGYWGMIPFVLGLLVRSEKKESWFFHWWLLGGLGYLVILASGNVTHDYYQAILIPAVSVFVAKGLAFLFRPPKIFSSLTAYCVLLTAASFSLAFGWYHIRDYFNINHPEIVEAGKAADRLLPKDALVVAPYGGDTAFLYQTNRKGWPVGGAIDDKLSKGATHYVSVKFDEEENKLEQSCRVLEKTTRFVIIDLQPCAHLFDEELL